MRRTTAGGTAPETLIAGRQDSRVVVALENLIASPVATVMSDRLLLRLGQISIVVGSDWAIIRYGLEREHVATIRQGLAE